MMNDILYAVEVDSLLFTEEACSSFSLIYKSNGVAAFVLFETRTEIFRAMGLR